MNNNSSQTAPMRITRSSQLGWDADATVALLAWPYGSDAVRNARTSLCIVTVVFRPCLGHYCTANRHGNNLCTATPVLAQRTTGAVASVRDSRRVVSHGSIEWSHWTCDVSSPLSDKARADSHYPVE